MLHTEIQKTMKKEEASDTRLNKKKKRSGKEKDYELIIGTWNVRTLRRQGAILELRKVIISYGADVVALQEMRWKGSGISRGRSNNADIYYSCQNQKHEFGCGFAVGSRLRKLVIGWNPASEKLCSIRIRGKFYNYSLICAHAPTDETEEGVKDDFYDHLDRLYSLCPSYDTKVLLGDFNAKLGRESVISASVGKHSLHETADWAFSRGVVISSTFFPHLKIHKATWSSPDQRTKNQIDHIAVDARHASNVLDVRTYRGANIDSDHFLVMAKIRSRIATPVPKHKQVSSTNTMREALKQQDLSTKFSELVARKLQSSDVDGTNGTEHWNVCSNAILQSAKEVLTINPPRRRSPWFDDECEIAINIKNEARQRKLQRGTRAAEDHYKEMRREAKRVICRKKRNYERAELQDLENLRSRNEVRKFYQKLKGQTKGSNESQTAVCYSKTGCLLANPEDVTKRWVEYFNELLNGNDTVTSPDLPIFHSQASGDAAHGTEAPPSYQEVTLAIRRLKNNKSPGSDGIPAEFLKAGGDVLAEHLHTVLQKIWTEEQLPPEWNISVICPILKKGDVKVCSNYRGISILNTSYKILSIILCERLKPYISNIIGPYQCGFRPGKSTVDQMFTLRQVLEKTHEFNVDTHHLFIDFKQAYDSIRRSSFSPPCIH